MKFVPIIKNLCYYQDMKIDTPIGELTILARDGAVTHIFFQDECPKISEENNDPVLKQAATELQEYFAGTRKVFTVPINPSGGAFHKKVWDEMARNLKFGTTTSYSELAQVCGSPKACRAVGAANNRNPIPVIIPCHRVLGKNGKLVGFRWGMGVKEKLLALETASPCG